MLGDWRWSLTGNYADPDQPTFTEQDDGTRDRFDSRQQTFGTNAPLPAPLTDGWAGPTRDQNPARHPARRRHRPRLRAAPPLSAHPGQRAADPLLTRAHHPTTQHP